MNKIILLGYMGCGKSTVASALSKKLSLPYVDLDLYIEEKSQKSITSIFKEKGEIYFRKLEHLYFKEILSSTEPLIIGLGGGTPCYANNHELLNENDVLSIYLKASVATLQQRLFANNRERPLIAQKTESELRDYIGPHLFERSFYYTRAKHTVVVDDKTVEETVNEIMSLLA